MPTLVLAHGFTYDSNALWCAAVRLGWDVQRLTRERISVIARSVTDPVLYLENLYELTIAQEFGLRLSEPPLDWLAKLPEEYRKRWMRVSTVRDVETLTGPVYIHPLSGLFSGRVEYPGQMESEWDEITVLISEVVEWEKEFRCFVLNRAPHAISLYVRDGLPDIRSSTAEEVEALDFIHNLLADSRIDVPRATVLDFGVIRGRGWAVVAQKAPWKSGIYGCDPERVLDVLRLTAVPL